MGMERSIECMARIAQDRLTMSKGACELKSAQISILRLMIYQTDLAAVQNFVADQVSAAPELFQDAAVALDLSACESAMDAALLEDLLMRLRYAGINPLGIIATEENRLAAAARTLGLSLLPEPRPSRAMRERESARDNAAPAPQHASAVVDAAPAPPAPVAVAAQPAPVQRVIETMPRPGTQRYHGQVRSGQQMYAKDQDLIVTGAVGASSEVIADGSVHIYGRLMGKVIAGATGDRDARIYCLAFGAELVSIAGIFRVFESIPADLAGKAVQISLDGDKLRFDPLN